MPYLIWDIVKGAFLLGAELFLLIIFLSIVVLLLLRIGDWYESRKEYAGLKKALLKRPFPKLDKERTLV